MISIIIPSHNNLRHLKNAYTSIKKHAPTAEIVLLDDASTDGTWDWIESLEDSNIVKYKSPTRDGHTVLYDMGIQLATNEIVGIFHADMIMGPNYVENIVKHLKPGVVVCGTRIEPPLHPAANEKIIQNFGLDFDSLDIDGFEGFVNIIQPKHKDQTTKGMFAPWVLYKEDFFRIGGHDWNFAPFPYEDSDLFQRWLLQGYELIQSRDAFVYHLTCRGHRWTGEIGKNDDYFIAAELKARKYYIKKWGSWIKNDQFQHPILIPVYKKCAIIKNYMASPLDDWFNEINPQDPNEFDVIMELDAGTFTEEEFNVVVNLNEIVRDTNELGKFKVGNLIITINSLADRSKELIFIDNDKLS
jgi:glycosyltransferase involved in cell wall biosynthesis